MMLACAVALVLAPALSAQPLPNSAFFVENRGQWPSEVRSMAALGALDAWITNNGIVYDFYRLREATVQAKSLDNSSVPQSRTTTSYSRSGHVVRMRFENAQGIAHGEERAQLPGHHNYFIGSDTSRWVRHVPLYAEARIDHLYPGIDARLTLERGGLRYDLLVAPDADPAQARLRFEGARRVWIDRYRRELVIETSEGEVRQGSLLAYQEINGARRQVACTFQQRADGSVGFRLGAYDRSRPLVIDPLIWSTYLPNLDRQPYSNNFAVSRSGSAVVLGVTGFKAYPTTPGAYNESAQPGNNPCDLVVAKFSPDARTLLFATYLGGAARDFAQSIRLGDDESIYIGGHTYSDDYPTTPGAFKQKLDSSYLVSYYDTNYTHASAFVTKLAADGSDLQWSTFIGPCMGEAGVYYDSGPSIAVNAAGEVYMTGQTLGPFPTTPGVVQPTAAPPYYEAFVCKLNRSGSGLLFSTYLGGSSFDEGTRIEIDSTGNIIVMGGTTSTDFPTTPGAFDNALGNSSPTPLHDLFVAKLNPEATRLIFSTYIGGAKGDEGAWHGLALGPDGTIYISGETYSPDFPVTPGAYKSVFDTARTPESHVFNTAPFVLALDSSGRLKYSTFVDNPAHALVPLASGAVWMSGGTNKPTPDAYNTVRNGGMDGTISLLDASGRRFLYSTFIGSTGADWIEAIAVRNDTIYGLARTYSTTFPVTPGVAFPEATFPRYNTAFFSEAAVFKLLIERTGCTFPASAGEDTTVCAGQRAVLRGTASGGSEPYTLRWRDENGLDISPDSLVYPASTTRYILVAHDAAGCTSLPDTVTVTVAAAPTGTLSAPPTSCVNSPTTLTATSISGGTGTRFQMLVNGSPVTPALQLGAVPLPFSYAPTFLQTGDYTIRLAVWDEATGCSDTVETQITVHAAPLPDLVVVGRLTLCEGDSLVLSTTAAYTSYRWSTGDSTRRLVVRDSGNYFVEVVDTNGCVGRSQSIRVERAAPAPIPTITQRGDTLYSSPASSYQWYRNGVPLPGETRQWLLPVSSGNYTVEAANAAGCGQMSAGQSAGTRRVVWLDTVSARVGERVALTMRVHPPLESYDSLTGFTARLHFEPTALFAHGAYSPDYNLTNDLALGRVDRGRTAEVVRASGSPVLSDSILFQLELEGLVTGQPLNVVEIESVITAAGDTLAVIGNGLVILDGCTIGRQFGKRAHLIAVSPNPAAANRLRLRWRAPIGTQPRLRLVDAAGTVLWSTQLLSQSGEEQESTLSVDLPNGVYILQLIERDETAALPLVIKN